MIDMRAVLARWLPLAAAVTVACALTYVGMQQSFRMSADDPQVQMAEDTAAALQRGSDPARLVNAPAIDAARSLSPFVIVFDTDGRPVASGAGLDGRTPVPPPGAFERAREHGSDRITWQPRRGVRLATVVVTYAGDRPGFVVAARSLREVERRIGEITRIAAMAWLVAVLATLAVTLIADALLLRRSTATGR